MMKLSRVLFPLLLLTITGHAQQVRLVSSGQMEVEVLRGLDSLTVEVKTAVPGFDAETIKRGVEKRLKGLPVVALSVPASGRLLVTLSSLDKVYYARVELKHLASLLGCETGDMFLTSMWQREGMGRDAPTLIASLIDALIADFNSINRR
jgi:hypothetical protein